MPYRLKNVYTAVNRIQCQYFAWFATSIGNWRCAFCAIHFNGESLLLIVPLQNVFLENVTNHRAYFSAYCLAVQGDPKKVRHCQIIKNRIK